MTFDPELLALARKIGRRSRGVRRVRTPEGSRKFGLPIGAIITADAELRAAKRHPGLKVPEDKDPRVARKNDTGPKRPKISAQELTTKLKNDPSFQKMKIVRPTGDQQVTVGKATFDFPSGSKVFRSKKHASERNSGGVDDFDFAIVRDPDYELYIVTSEGNASALDGEAEKILNERFDDLDDNADDPDFTLEKVGQGEETEEFLDTEEIDYTQYESVEDVPEYLSDSYIDNLIKGMEDDGVDPTLTKTLRAHLQKQNDQIKAKWDEANDPETAARNKQIRDLEDQMAALQKQLESLRGGSKKDSSEDDDSGAVADDSKDPADVEDPDPIDDESGADETDDPADAPDGAPAESRRAKKSNRPKRAADTDDEDSASTDGAPKRAAKSERSEDDEDPAPESTEDRTEDTEEEAEPDPETSELDRIETQARKLSVGTGSGQINGKSVHVRRNRQTDTFEYSVGDEEGDTSFESRDELLDHLRTSRDEAPRDTSDLDPADFEDDELEDVIADLDDALLANKLNSEGHARLKELQAERRRRRAPKPKKTSREMEFTQPVADRSEILNARPGDRFLTSLDKDKPFNGISTETWTVGDDLRVRSDDEYDASELSLAEFADAAEADPDAHVRASNDNSKNTTDRPDPNPGDVATDDWLDKAPAGSTVRTSDSIHGTKQDDGTFNTAMGDVKPDFFAPSDVQNEDSVVVSPTPEEDGRPAGATSRIASAEDLTKVRRGDHLAMEGSTATATRREDGTWDFDLNGLVLNIRDTDILSSAGWWHVPNQDRVPDAPEPKPSKVGDTVEDLDTLANLRPGTKLRYKFVRPKPNGESESTYEVLPEGKVRKEGTETVLDYWVLKNAVNSGRVSVSSLPSKDRDQTDAPEVPEPKAITKVSDYADGDKITDYKHLKAMKPGTQVTLTIPASKNAGQSTAVVLTRTDDNKDAAGFMFLVGKRGAGYNSFGENNASIFQAIYDGRLYFGDVSKLPDAPDAETVDGNWDTTPNIPLWDGGPQVSEYDLRTFIDAQVYSRAMQGSYYNTDLLPKTSPFRSQTLRKQLSERALKKYSTYDDDGNILIPARHKPAMIRYASEKLGLQFTDPGAALIPDDLELADFKNKITVGKFANKNGKPSSETGRMGPEQIEITVADAKTALAVLDSMDTMTEEDPNLADKILKRVMAMRGSSLQDMNVALGIAAYYGVRRYKNGKLMSNVSAARQKDKRRNKELLRRMLLEQMEGREVGYYGLPDDEVYYSAYDEKGNGIGDMYVNRTTLSRPAINSDNDPDRRRDDEQEPVNPPTPAAPEAPQDAPDDVPADDNEDRDTTDAPEAPESPVADSEDYRGHHVAPGPDGDDPMIHDAEEFFPGIYSLPEKRAKQLYSRSTYEDRAVEVIRSTQGNPDAEVTIYRAVPRGKTDINSGDWVTIDRAYAEIHGRSNLNDDYDIIEKKVRARELFTEGNSVVEWGYHEDRDSSGDAPGADTDSPQRRSLDDFLQDREHRTYTGDEDPRMEAQKAQYKSKWNSNEVFVVLGDSTVKLKHVSSDREGYELDPSETEAFSHLAQQISDSVSAPHAAEMEELLDPANLNGKRMFIDREGSVIAALDGERIIGPFSLGNRNGHYRQDLTKKAVRAGGRYAVSPDDITANRYANAGLHATHVLPDGSMVYRYDPEKIGDTYDRTTVGVAPSLDAALVHHEAYRKAYEANEFHITLDQGEMGDGHIRDANGKRTKMWGKYGAAGLMIRHVDQDGTERFFMTQRSGKNGRWQLAGGAINSKETDESGAARETFEEVKPPEGYLASLSKVGTNRFDDQATGWHYSSIAVDAPEQFTPILDPAEIADAKWLTRQEIADMAAKGELTPPVEASIRKTMALWGGTEADALPDPTPDPDEETEVVTHASINDPGAKRGTFSGGSNGGRDYFLPMSDGSTGHYFVKPTKSQDAGRQEALASALYREAGITAPEVDYNEDDRQVYSKMIEGASSTVPSNGIDLAKEGFAVDAWLANWDIRLGDNVMFDKDGKPIRLDNGGSLEYRAQGGKKGSGGTTGFGNTVTELDTLRDPRNLGHNIFGSRRGSTPDPWEVTSAQKVVNISDDRIKAMVADHNLPDSLADTLIARRDNIAQRYNLTPKPKAVTASPTQRAAAPEQPELPEAQVAESLSASIDPTPNTPDPAVPTRGSYLADDATHIEDDSSRAAMGAAPMAGDWYSITMSDGSEKTFSVIKPKVAEQGKSSALASSLYKKLGVGTVNLDYDENEDRTYTELVSVGQDPGQAGIDDFRQGFVADAWLANWDAPNSSKFVYDGEGKAVRTDLRNALEYRVSGQKKTFGATVPELTSMRTQGHGASVYGPPSAVPQDWEYDSAQKVVDLPDDAIRDMVQSHGMDDSLADTLIARRDYIADHYGLFPSTDTSIPSREEFAEVNEASNLADARKAVTSKADYVRAFLPEGADYRQTLKTAGGVSGAFDSVWRANNPDKPDRAPLGDLPLVDIDDPNIGAEEIAELALQFDFSQAALDDVRTEIGIPNVNSAVVVHQAVLKQRGFLKTNEPVSWVEFEQKIADGSHTHVFRTVYGSGTSWYNRTPTISGSDVAKQHKQDGKWLTLGNGGTAHGLGIYTSESLDDSLDYGSGHSDAVWFDMALDTSDLRVAPSIKFRRWSNAKINAAVDAIIQRTDLDTDQQQAATEALTDAGTLAAMLGYDALYGNQNAGFNNYNVLNKSKVTFNDFDPMPLSSTPHQSYSQTKGGDAGVRARARFFTAQSTAGTMETDAASGSESSGTFSSGQVLGASQIGQLRIGSTVTTTLASGAVITLRLGPRGWVNTATNRVQGWMGNLTPRSRKQFVVINAT